MPEPDDEGGSAMRPVGEPARLTLGAELAELRRRRGLTGHQLGRLVRMSQAKISKIENGTVTPNAADVEKIARALRAPAGTVRALVDQATSLHQELVDRRVTAAGMIPAQQHVAATEARARTVRTFQPAVVPGLLQTAEYARAVIADYLSASRGDADDGAEQRIVPTAVTTRIQRQEALSDPDKQFYLVLTETVLMNRVCSPVEMVAQLDRIRTVAAAHPNVVLGIVPVQTQLRYPPIHGFQLFDERSLLIDLANTTVESREREVVAVYRTIFDYFFEQATPEIGPILDRYTRQYAALIAPRDGADG